MKRLAIIPARSGSKRIKNKNFKIFNGKPIIDFTVKNLINSKLFNTIHISSDVDIKNKTFYYKNIDFFIRPKKLSNDKTPINDVAEWVIKEYEKKNIYFDIVCIAYATAPLIDFQDFRKACKIFEKSNKKNPLLSVGEFKPSIDEALISKKNTISPIFEKKFFKDSKKHKKYFYDSASFMFANKNHFLKKKKSNFYIKYVLDRYKGIDINDKNDFNFVKKIFFQKLKKS